MPFIENPYIPVDLARSPKENLVLLLNAVTDESLTADDIVIDGIESHPDSEELGATRITVSPVDTYRYSGNAKFNYQRLDIERVAEGLEIKINAAEHENIPSLLDDLSAQIGLLPGQIRMNVNSIADLIGDNPPSIVTLSALANSVVYVGTLAISYVVRFEQLFSTSHLKGFAYSDEVQASMEAQAS